MLYAIIATDTLDSLSQRMAARPAHLARLEALNDAGRLVLAGPHPAIDSSDPSLESLKSHGHYFISG